MPSLEKLHRNFRNRDFILLSISVGEEAKTVRDFMQKNGYTFHALLDSNSEVAGAYNVRQHPMKFLVGNKGELIGYSIGYGKWDSPEMRELLNRLIGS